MLSKLSTFAAMAFVTGFPLCTMHGSTFDGQHSESAPAPAPLKLIAHPIPPAMEETPDRPVPSPTIIRTKKVQPQPTTDCMPSPLGLIPKGC